ncbi:hypothetical protein SprV_0301144600 [Sparganum proliferum]
MIMAARKLQEKCQEMPARPYTTLVDLKKAFDACAPSNSVYVEVNTFMTTGVESDAVVDGKPKKPATHAERGAADLEKVTDFVEETEFSAGFGDAVKAVTNDVDKKSTPVLPKIKLKNEDVELLVREFEVSKLVAEKKLKEFQGNVRLALIAMSR